MTTARATAGSASSKRGSRHHEKARVGIQVAILTAIDGCFVGADDPGLERIWHGRTLAPAPDSATLPLAQQGTGRRDTPATLNGTTGEQLATGVLAIGSPVATAPYVDIRLGADPIAVLPIPSRSPM